MFYQWINVLNHQAQPSHPLVKTTPTYMRSYIFQCLQFLKTLYSKFPGPLKALLQVYLRQVYLRQQGHPLDEMKLQGFPYSNHGQLFAHQSLLPVYLLQRTHSFDVMRPHGFPDSNCSPLFDQVSLLQGYLLE
ncbi:hypothetical protein V8G54_015807 [Vigna mungo]|uniref:Uncharacterized protein n=1 Tax=Vigna mungo TaxID=3915 RepID=A0AAQ3NKZ7_VIGMU